MLSNFNHTTRRRFCTILGGSALLGIATENLVSVAQTSPPAVNTDVIGILVDEHRRIEALMNQIAQTPASNPTQRTQLLQQLINLLTVHNFTEENLVYPAIRDIANLMSDATTLYQEQDQSKVLAFELNQLPKSDPDWSNLFATFQSALLSHVAQEENVDFPRLRTAVGPKIAQLTTQALQLRSHWR